ncbi:MAG: hypothetical protein ACRDLS_12740 [Solirubrobacteraceae bacterium]
MAREHLIALGFGRHAIGRMISTGLLEEIHRGVYGIGPAKLTREGRWMAAVLAGGRDAALSHASAAALWQLLAHAAREIEVTSPRRRHSRHGLRFRFACLAADEVITEDGIDVTTVARTLFDIAATEPRRRVERAIHEANVRRR